MFTKTTKDILKEFASTIRALEYRANTCGKEADLTQKEIVRLEGTRNSMKAEEAYARKVSGRLKEIINE